MCWGVCFGRPQSVLKGTIEIMNVRLSANGVCALAKFGLYCDGKVGGAAATGIGEEVIKVCGSYQVVEFMRQGLDPEVKQVAGFLTRWTCPPQVGAG